ncbi:MAG: ActR/PrrA/RegA family redox response regulator transcription factor [Rhodospirillales bacterium]|nr:ActR/PrrA/RegA family redox response regulator transcription factor [Rhodospirillales bacterium]
MGDGENNVTPDEGGDTETQAEVRSLLIVDDDQPFRDRLARAMEQRGFEVTAVEALSEAYDAIDKAAPDFALIDLNLGDGYGLDLVPVLKQRNSNIRIVVLTGYGNIASAVSAVKAGAVNYLAKPADADDIEAALLAEGTQKPAPPSTPMSVDRVRWEHIQRVYELCDRNISETARRLKMHRRTLQRIFSKHPPQ